MLAAAFALAHRRTQRRREAPFLTVAFNPLSLLRPTPAL